MDHIRWQASRNPDNPVTLTPVPRVTLKNGREVQSLVKVTGGNKHQRLADPAPLPPLPIHILTVNIDGVDPGK